MNSHNPSFERRPRTYAGWKTWMHCLACLALASPLRLPAEQIEKGIITLMPVDVQPQVPNANSPLTLSADADGHPKSTIRLKFDASSLPTGATISEARLILGPVKENTPAGQTITVQAEWKDKEAMPMRFGAIDLLNGKTYDRLIGTAFRSFTVALPAHPQFSLSLETNSPNTERDIYSGEAKPSKLRPRLVLEYTIVPGQPLTQSDGIPAVQSSQPFLPEREGATSGPFFYVTRPFPVAWSYTPAFYHNLVFLVTDSGGKKELNALNPLGSQIWSIPLSGSLGQHLLVSNSGRLYLVGENRIMVFQVDPTNPAKPPAPALHDVLVEDLKPARDVPPSLGPDGSLYLVNQGAVYGFNPDVQQLWMLTLGDMTTSRVTVGPSGRFVYLTARKKGLVAINAQTGESIENLLPDQAALEAAGKPDLHAPVVFQYSDGSERIYAAANFSGKGILACVENTKTILVKKEKDGEIKAAVNWPKTDPPSKSSLGLPGLWSQPIFDQLPAGPAKRIYAVQVASGKGTLEAIDWSTGATQPATWLKGTPEAQATQFSVGDGSYLVNGGHLASDQAGKRFVWNGAGDAGDIGLYAFGPGFSGLLTPAEQSGIPTKAQLYFGTEGTLYANEVEAAPVLRAIVPQYTLDEHSGVTITSHTHLRVDGKAGPTTRLEASGSVLLGPGFAVPKGHPLIIGQPPAKRP